MAEVPLKRRGRRSGRQPAARAQILDALARLLGDAPQRLPTLRAVADAARVSPALLHYHFADLPGLLQGLLAERALPLIEPLLLELRAPADAASTLARFLPRWTSLMLRHPWITPCLLQAPAVETRKALSRLLDLRAAVASAQREGSVRRDLPEDYLALLLLSLGFMPHLARTTLGDGVDAGGLADPELAASLALRHLAVLQAGIAAVQRPRQDSGS